MAACSYACGRSAPFAHSDSTSVAYAVARNLGHSGTNEDTPERSLVRVTSGPTAFDSLVATLLRTHYSTKFINDDDSVFVRRVATDGLSFRGDTAVVAVRWAECVRAGNDPFTWRAEAVEYMFVPDEEGDRDSTRHWRDIGAGTIALLDGACGEQRWPARWLEAAH